MKDIYNYSIVGFEFEFFSKKGIDYVKKELTPILSKKILIFEEVHGEFEPTDSIFKLEKDYSGGDEMIELITGPLTYNESRLILYKVLSWIKSNENVFTSNRCSLQFNISFNTKFTGNSFLTHLNTLKFILELDEEKILEHFPKRKDSVYSKSIKYILPLNKFYIDDLRIQELAPKNFILPFDKYYGVNFSKLIKGYLEFRYLGGKDYDKKYQETQDVVDYCIETLYESLRSPAYTKRNLEEITRILAKHKKVIDSYRSYADFLKNYPKIKLSVDLNFDPVRIDVFFDKFRDELFNILSLSSLKTGYINYDSDTSRLQLKNTTLSHCYDLYNVDIVESKINGTLRHCKLFDCEIKNSDFQDCKVYGGSNIINSKLKNCYISRYTVLTNSYIHGRNSILNGVFKSGIFREGNISNTAEIKSIVKVVDFKKI